MTKAWKVTSGMPMLLAKSAHAAEIELGVGGSTPGIIPTKSVQLRHGRLAYDPQDERAAHSYAEARRYLERLADRFRR